MVDLDDEYETTFEEQLEGLDPIIRSETRRILGEWLAIGSGLPTDEREHLYDVEALRLQQLADQTAHELRQANQAQWRQDHPGQLVPHADAVRWYATAERQARETVLSIELYPQVTPEVVEERKKWTADLDARIADRHEQARLARDSDRWKSDNVAWMPVAERVAHRLWFDKSGWFLSLGQALITQRIEDGLPVPATMADPLCEQLEVMIAAEIAANPPADLDMPF